MTGQGNGTTGNFATVEVTLSNDATATTSTGETLTFTNNADVSEGDYSVGASSTVTARSPVTRRLEHGVNHRLVGGYR